METNINKRNNYITTYESIYKKLKTCTETFLKFKTEPQLEQYILQQRKPNQNNMQNTLIEIPDENIKKLIEKMYTKISYLEGPIGTLEPDDQFDGIINMSLLMLMSNRLSKDYKYFLEKRSLSQETKEIYKKNKNILLTWKDEAMSDLISSLFVLENTNKDYSNFFSYGYRKDNNQMDSFVIDLPFFGQICVHFGPKMEEIISTANKKANSILEKKLELNQISNTEFEKIKANLESNIFPDYTGKLFEYNATIPIEYEGPKIKKIKNELGLKEFLPEDIDDKNLKKITNRLNNRESYYLAIKMGLPKNKLQQLLKIEEKILDVKTVGKVSLKQTNAEERETVSNYEKNIFKENDIHRGD